MIFDIGIQGDLSTLIETCAFIQSSRGGGKSHLMRKFNEIFSGHCQQIIIDREGEFVTLREKHPFALLAVKGGDIPLNPAHGATYARKFMESQLSVIIDVSDLLPKEMQIFVRDFLHALMHLPDDLYHPLLVYIDEAQLFCPQDESAPAYGSIIDLVSRGRKRDIGVIMATLRMSTVHKDVTAQLGNKFIGRTGQDNDQIRAGKELDWKPAQYKTLRNLPAGEFYCFGPAFQDEPVKFKVSPVETTHKKKGSRSMVPPAPKAIESLISALRDLPAEAEQELRSMEDLHKEVARLKDQLSRWGAGTPPNDKEAGLIMRFQHHLAEKSKELAGLYTRVEMLETSDGKLRETLEKFRDVLRKINLLSSVEEHVYTGNPITDLYWNPNFDPVMALANGSKIIATPQKPEDQLKDLNIPSNIGEGVGKLDVFMVQDPGNFKSEGWDVKTGIGPLMMEAPAGMPLKLSRCERTILTFLAGWDRGFSTWVIAFITRYSEKSSGFQQAFTELRREGLIQKKGDLWSANDAEIISGPYLPDPIFEKKLTAYSWDKHLTKVSLTILILLRRSTHAIFDRKALADLCGYSYNSSGYQQALTELDRLEMITRTKEGVTFNNDLIHTI